MRGLLASSLLVACALTVAQGGRAQGFNVELGTALGPIAVPPADHEGAAGQPGFWNNVGRVTDFALNGLDGIATEVTVSVNAGFGNGSAGIATTTDPQKVGHDFIYSSFGAGWSIDVDNLADGAYDVYVIRPHHPTITTGQMEVGGVALPLLDYADGPDPFDYQADETYAMAEVVVSGGSLAMSGDGVTGGYTGLAGFQLVSVPEPETGIGAAAALAATALGRRRSRAAA